MKTKFFISAIFFSSIANFAFAQAHDEFKSKCSLSIAYNSVEAQIGKPEETVWKYAYASTYDREGDKKDNSYSFSIIPKYSISDDVTLRFEFSITKINVTNYYFISHNQYGYFKDTIQQKIFRYMPGIQWSFFKKKRIETYCGLSAIYLNYGKTYWSEYSIDLNPGGNWYFLNTSVPGGFAAGAGAFAGFNFYLHKNISFGAELSSSLLYYKIGGKFTASGIHFITSSGTTNVLDPYWIAHDSFEGTQFSKMLSSFNISIYF
ncbi:MAG: hypothetical protein JJE25_10990 [Bacteroidia bacterium]|nr:hypothetical protein [Bacteroidia bacterium]